MIRSASLLSAVLCAIAWGICPSPVVAQYGENQQYSRQVLVEGRRGLSDSAVDAVGNLVAKQLSKAQQQKDLPAIWGAVRLHADGAQLGEDAGMGYFAIELAGEITLNEVQLQTLWDESLQAMQKSLRIVQQRTQNGQLAQLDRQRVRLDQQRQQTLHKLDEAIKRLETLDGSNNSQEQIEQQLAAAVNMLRELQLDRVGLDARRKAIDERTDYLRDHAKAETEADPIIGELRKIVEIRGQQVARVRQLFDTGQLSVSELGQGDADLAAARIELLKTQRSASDQSSGVILQELNNELSKLFVQDAELQARGEALESTVKELSAQASVAVRAEIATLLQSVKSLRQRLATIDDETTELENKIQSADGGEITIRPLEEALLGDDAEAAPTETP